MKKIAVFPGSFDPITVGHESIIKRSIPLFDEYIIAIGQNSNKSYQFSLEQRIKWIQQVFQEYDNVRVEAYDGLTVDYCKTVGANYIIRGLRTSADFEFERGIAQMNRAMLPDLDTMFLLTPPELSAISSSIVRDILSHGGDVSQFVPNGIDLK